MAIRALVTAFEPFGGDQTNASLEAVRRLPPSVATIEVVTAELPTSFGRSSTVLKNAIARYRPDRVLCVGQAGERVLLCAERLAVNIQDARIADNDGAMPIDVPVVAGAPAAYFSTLPIKAIVEALQAAKLPAAVSDSAGTFVCNHVFYGLMHYAATEAPGIRAGLMHVPRFRGQAGNQSRALDGNPWMALDDIVRGIVIALEVTAGRRSAS